MKKLQVYRDLVLFAIFAAFLCDLRGNWRRPKDETTKERRGFAEVATKLRDERSIRATARNPVPGRAFRVPNCLNTP